MRRLITYFVNYPKAINILVLFFIVFGTAGTLALKSSFYPLIDPKFIEISAVLPGASPEEVEEGIVMKIEENLKGIEGVDRYYSTSRENLGYILVETLEDSDVDNVLIDVKNAVDKVPSFPLDLETIVVKKMEQQEPTFIFSLTAENIDLSSLKNISKKIEVDLRNLEGISQISTSGFSDNEIEISVNEKLLSKYNVTFYEILDAVQKSNIIVSGGTIKTNEEKFLIRSNNKNYYSNQLNEIVVKSFPSGNNLKLGDIPIDWGSTFSGFIGLLFVGSIFVSIGILSSLFAVALNIIELLVAAIQAYVFTMFSSVYIGLAIEEEH